MSQVFDFGIGLTAVDHATPAIHGVIESVGVLESRVKGLDQVMGQRAFSSFNRGVTGAARQVDGLANSLDSLHGLKLQDVFGGVDLSLLVRDTTDMEETMRDVLTVMKEQRDLVKEMSEAGRSFSDEVAEGEKKLKKSAHWSEQIAENLEEATRQQNKTGAIQNLRRRGGRLASAAKGRVQASFPAQFMKLIFDGMKALNEVIDKVDARLQQTARLVGDSGFSIQGDLRRLGAELGQTAEESDRAFNNIIKAGRGFGDVLDSADVETATKLDVAFGEIGQRLESMSAGQQKNLLRLVDTMGMNADEAARFQRAMELSDGTVQELLDTGATFQKKFGVPGLIRTIPESVEFAKQAQSEFSFTVGKSAQQITTDVTRMAGVYAKALGKSAPEAARLARQSFQTFTREIAASEDVFLGLADDFGPLTNAFLDAGVTFDDTMDILRKAQTDPAEFVKSFRQIQQGLDPLMAMRFERQVLREADEGVRRLITGQKELSEAEKARQATEDPMTFANMTKEMRNTAEGAIEIQANIVKLTKAMVGFDAAPKFQKMMGAITEKATDLADAMIAAREANKAWYQSLTTGAAVTKIAEKSPALEFMRNFKALLMDTLDDMGEFLTALAAAGLVAKKVADKFSEVRQKAKEARAAEDAKKAEEAERKRQRAEEARKKAEAEQKRLEEEAKKAKEDADRKKAADEAQKKAADERARQAEERAKQAREAAKSKGEAETRARSEEGRLKARAEASKAKAEAGRARRSRTSRVVKGGAGALALAGGAYAGRDAYDKAIASGATHEEAMNLSLGMGGVAVLDMSGAVSGLTEQGYDITAVENLFRPSHMRKKVDPGRVSDEEADRLGLNPGDLRRASVQDRMSRGQVGLVNQGIGDTSRALIDAPQHAIGGLPALAGRITADVAELGTSYGVLSPEALARAQRFKARTDRFSDRMSARGPGQMTASGELDILLQRGFGGGDMSDPRLRAAHRAEVERNLALFGQDYYSNVPLENRVHPVQKPAFTQAMDRLYGGQGLRFVSPSARQRVSEAMARFQAQRQAQAQGDRIFGGRPTLSLGPGGGSPFNVGSGVAPSVNFREARSLADLESGRAIDLPQSSAMLSAILGQARGRARSPVETPGGLPREQLMALIVMVEEELRRRRPYEQNLRLIEARERARDTTPVVKVAVSPGYDVTTGETSE